MEQIKIFFYVLASFFGIEDGRIAADKTTVTLYPEKKEIKIIQEDLFTIIQSENDSVLTLEHWNNLINQKEITWSRELDSFLVKNFTLINEENIIQPQVTLNYLNEKDLSALGIWYNEEKNQFSMNHIPNDNVKTKDGELKGNFWYFNGEISFSFTVEPFIEWPEDHQKLKTTLKELITEFKKK